MAASSPEEEARNWLRDEPVDSDTPLCSSSAGFNPAHCSRLPPLDSSAPRSFSCSSVEGKSEVSGEVDAKQMDSQQDVKNSATVSIVGSVKNANLHSEQEKQQVQSVGKISGNNQKPSSNSHTNNPKIDLWKDVRLCQWFKEHGYRLSASDIKKIKLKVSAVQEATERLGAGHKEKGVIETLKLILERADRTILPPTRTDYVTQGSSKDDPWTSAETKTNAGSTRTKISDLGGIPEKTCGVDECRPTFADLPDLGSLESPSSEKGLELSINDLIAKQESEVSFFSDASNLSLSFPSFPTAEDFQASRQTKSRRICFPEGVSPYASGFYRSGPFPVEAAPNSDLYCKDIAPYFSTSSTSSLCNVGHLTCRSTFPPESMSFPPLPFQSIDEGMRVGSMLLTGRLGSQMNEHDMKNVTGPDHSLKSTSSLATPDADNMNMISPTATRAARKRRMARQRRVLQHKSRLTLQAFTTSLARSREFPSRNDNKSLHHCQNEQEGDLANPEEEIMSLERTLRLLLQKELRPSDVGNLGRIILPKKDAETNLPHLIAREGMVISMEDMASSRIWKLRFRFWPNNKSRMYLLENTGEFVKSHRLREGDFMVIYKDIVSGTYVVGAKKVARSDFPSITCGKRTPRQKPVHMKGSHALTDDIYSDATSLSSGAEVMDNENGADSNITINMASICTKSAAFEEGINNLDDSFFEEFVQGLPDAPRIDNDILPQLENVPNLDHGDISLEKKTDIKDTQNTVLEKKMQKANIF